MQSRPFLIDLRLPSCHVSRSLKRRCKAIAPRKIPLTRKNDHGQEVNDRSQEEHRREGSAQGNPRISQESCAQEVGRKEVASRFNDRYPPTAFRSSDRRAVFACKIRLHSPIAQAFHPSSVPQVRDQ